MLTVNLEGLPRLGFDPFSIDVGDILLEERRVIKLVESVSKCKKANSVVFGMGRTGGML